MQSSEVIVSASTDCSVRYVIFVYETAEIITRLTEADSFIVQTNFNP